MAVKPGMGGAAGACDGEGDLGHTEVAEIRFGCPPGAEGARVLRNFEGSALVIKLPYAHSKCIS